MRRNLLKLLFSVLISLLSSINQLGFTQISGPEGLNMPGAWNDWNNPPTNLAFASSTQVTNGRVVLISNGTAHYQTIFSVAASGGDLTQGTYSWLFTSGPVGNYYGNKWGSVGTVTMNTLQDYTRSLSASDNSISIVNNKWYTMNWKDAGYVNTQAIFMETSGEPVTINSVSQNPPAAHIYPGQSVDITVTTNATPCPEEKIYIRYSNDDFNTSSLAQVSFSGASGNATIPALSGIVKYYVFSTTITSPAADYDLYTIKFNNNSGSNYSYTVKTAWITANNGNWTETNTWEGGVVPISNQPVTINHNVILNQSVTVSAITINGSLTSQNATSWTLAISDGGTFTNNGSFVANTGNVEFEGTGTLNGSSSTTFYNLRLYNVTTFETSPAVNFILQLVGTSGIAGNSPVYNSSSRLQYMIGGSRTRGLEWTSASSGPGYPNHVNLDNNTILNMGNTVAACGGNLTVNFGSTLHTTTTAITTINGNTVIDGTINLLGDIKAGGNWTIGSSGVQTNNNKAVFFTGTGEQVISKTDNGTVYFDYLVLDKATGSLKINNAPATNIAINTNVGNVLQLNNTAPLDLNGQSFTLDSPGGDISVNGARTITSSINGGKFIVADNKNVSGTGTLNFGMNVIVSLSDGSGLAGFNCGESGKTTIDGVLEINSGGFINLNAPIYGVGSLLKYNIGGYYKRDVEWIPGAIAGAGYPHDILVTGNTALDVGFGGPTQPLQLAGNLTVDNGSGFYMDHTGNNMTVPVVLSGNLNLHGNLSLSGSFGGDLKLGGNWSRSTGNFNPNNRAVFFNGVSGTQTISATGGEIFDYVIVDKSNDDIILTSNITINDTLTLTSGLISTGSSKVSIANGGGIKSASANSYINGFLTQTFSSAGSKSFPIGKGGFYRPLEFTYVSLSSLSAVTASQYEAQLSGIIPAGMSLIHERYWDIHHTATGVFSYKVSLDGTDFTPEGTIKMLKKEVGIIDHFSTSVVSHPVYINTNEFSTLIDTNSVTLALDCSEFLADAGKDTVICLNGFANLNANDPNPGTGQWSVISGPDLSISQISGINNPNAVFTPSGGQGAYLLEWKVSFEICPDKVDTVTINAGPIEVLANSGNLHACYPTLKAAFDSINKGYHQGVITIKVNGNTAENATAQLNASGGLNPGNYSGITIYPTQDSLSIKALFSGPLIVFNGAENVKIDGRVDTIGSNIGLTISNAVPGGPSSAITFANGASNNTVKYCKIICDSTSANGGVILFAHSLIAGCNNNVIANNDITSSGIGRPINAIYSKGSPGFVNTGNFIVYNQIYNNLNKIISSNCIFLDVYNSHWEIGSNSFYETSPAFAAQANAEYSIIKVVNDGNQYVVFGNSIGGSQPLCAGNFTKSGENNNLFRAIYLKVNGAIVSNNKIQKIAWSNSGNADWIGIHVENGNYEIVGNEIGSDTGNDNLLMTAGSLSGQTGAIFYGVSIKDYTSLPNEIRIAKNKIGAITTDNNNPNNPASFIGIFINPLTLDSVINVEIDSNIIGSKNTQNSINARSEAKTTRQSVFGIYNNDNCNLSITNNIIANLRNSSTNNETSSNNTQIPNTTINGITSEAGHITVRKNIISDLTIFGGINPQYYSSVIGVNLMYPLNYDIELSQNIIRNLKNLTTNTSAVNNVVGLYFNSGSGNNIIERNYLTSLINNSKNIGSNVQGIFVAGGSSVFKNNIIWLGSELQTGNLGINGFYEETGTNDIIYNTVIVDGVCYFDDGTPTHAFESLLSISSSRQIKNNLFVNRRSNSGSGSLTKHYAISLNNVDSTTIDYNNYYDSAGILGYLEEDKTTLLDWQNATSQDQHSVSLNPAFTAFPPSQITDLKPLADFLLAEESLTITKDYLDLDRCFPTMGALEAMVPVTQPVFAMGDSSTRCQGVDTVSYSASTSFSNSLTYSLDAASLAGGNSIDSEGAVSYVASWTGTTTITATAKGCGGPLSTTHTVTIIPSVPLISDPQPLSFCVIDIEIANYLDSTMDITPERPEYYLFHAADSSLNLDPTTFSDSCCGIASLNIRWQITFADGTYLPPMPSFNPGQPSEYPFDIVFPGSPTGDVIHFITYWLVDCNGNISAQAVVPITIKPRPQIDKIPP